MKKSERLAELQAKLKVVQERLKDPNIPKEEWLRGMKEVQTLLAQATEILLEP